MATTGLEVFNLAMDKMDEREDNGTLDSQSTANYKAKAPGLLTTIQNELLRVGDYYKQIKFSPLDIKPVYDKLELVHTNNDVQITVDKFSSYTFEINSTATITIDESDGAGGWIVLETITTNIDDMSYNEIRGTITPTKDKVRITFSGDYYFKVKNMALYAEKFNNVNNIPCGGEFFKYYMPEDFNSQSEIRAITSNGRELTDNYEWDGKDILLVPKDENKEILIEYRPLPPDIVDLTENLVIDDRTAKTAMVNALVTELMLADENRNASYYNGKQQENYREAQNINRPERTEIIQVINTDLGVRA